MTIAFIFGLSASGGALQNKVAGIVKHKTGSNRFEIRIMRSVMCQREQRRDKNVSLT
jgi:hypothetical protein